MDHEGTGLVVDGAAGVPTLRKGDHAIPLNTSECRVGKFCISRKTKRCQPMPIRGVVILLLNFYAKLAFCESGACVSSY